MKKFIEILMVMVLFSNTYTYAADARDYLRNTIGGAAVGALWGDSSRDAGRGAAIGLGATLLGDALDDDRGHGGYGTSYPSGGYDVGGQGTNSAYSQRRAQLQAELQRYQECRARQQAERDLGFPIRTHCRDPRR